MENQQGPPQLAPFGGPPAGQGGLGGPGEGPAGAQLQGPPGLAAVGGPPVGGAPGGPAGAQMQGPPGFAAGGGVGGPQMPPPLQFLPPAPQPQVPHVIPFVVPQQPQQPQQQQQQPPPQCNDRNNGLCSSLY